MPSEVHVSVVDVAKQVRAAVKRACGGKISVTSSGHVNVVWTDDGPSVAEVKAAILKAGCAEAHKHWDGTIYLRAHEYSVWFDRYNVADRAAKVRERELEKQREEESVRAAYAARKEATRGTRVEFGPPPSPEHARAAHEAFEKLRLRAEMDVASDAELSRRPSWAPPLILEGELLEIYHELGYLAPDDKPIARLWAQFADPKPVGTNLRETVSSLALPGIVCRGFQLHPGGERQRRAHMLFEAQRQERSGEWRFGPNYRFDLDYQSLRGSRQQYEWERLVRRRAGETDAALIEQLTQQIAALDAEYQVATQARNKRQALRRRAVELAKARVLDFAGAPDAQMQMASRLWGHCCVCGKILTDPISLERGIGPDCLANEVYAVRVTAIRLRSVGESADAMRVAARTHLPLDFVAAVLST